MFCLIAGPCHLERSIYIAGIFLSQQKRFLWVLSAYSCKWALFSLPPCTTDFMAPLIFPQAPSYLYFSHYFFWFQAFPLLFSTFSLCSSKSLVSVLLLSFSFTFFHCDFFHSPFLLLLPFPSCSSLPRWGSLFTSDPIHSCVWQIWLLSNSVKSILIFHIKIIHFLGGSFKIPGKSPSAIQSNPRLLPPTDQLGVPKGKHTNLQYSANMNLLKNNNQKTTIWTLTSGRSDILFYISGTYRLG